jgi:hypothetical protein
MYKLRTSVEWAAVHTIRLRHQYSTAVHATIEYQYVKPVTTSSTYSVLSSSIPVPESFSSSSKLVKQALYRE